jgi:hypothetical protein
VRPRSRPRFLPRRIPLIHGGTDDAIQ